eukprot:598278-Hanusia_phi.AAC.3
MCDKLKDGCCARGVEDRREELKAKGLRDEVWEVKLAGARGGTEGRRRRLDGRGRGRGTEKEENFGFRSAEWGGVDHHWWHLDES